MSKQDQYDLMDVRYKPKEYGGECAEMSEIANLKMEVRVLTDRLTEAMDGWKKTEEELNKFKAENLKLRNRLWKEIMRDE